ncbi:MAG TPA: sugar ABC transporter permease [Acidimicrobiales bacterium]|nr:sugar ABC transporter permease [Acidimicrobiales bacterium]
MSVVDESPLAAAGRALNRPIRRTWTARGGVHRGDARYGLLFLLPFCAALIVFQYVAIGLMIRNSLFSYSFLGGTTKFVGVGNYTTLVHDPLAIQSIEVTVLFALGSVLLQVPLGLALAILLNRPGLSTTALRAIIFSPVVSSVVVVTTMWTFIYAPSGGLANSILAVFGIAPLKFITSSNEALASVIVMTLWEEVGFSMVLFLAGLQAIPRDYEEVAALDGAGALQRFWYVVLPLLRRTTLLVVVTTTVFSFQAFAQAEIMTNGGPNGSTNFMVFNIYEEAFTLGDPGYASALSVVLLLIVLVVSLTQMRAIRSRV